MESQDSLKCCWNQPLVASDCWIGWHGLFFRSEDGVSNLRRNYGRFVPNCTLTQSIRQFSLVTAVRTKNFVYKSLFCKGLNPGSPAHVLIAILLYRVIHKCLRDFRTRLHNNQDRHGRKELINR